MSSFSDMNLEEFINHIGIINGDDNLHLKTSPQNWKIIERLNILPRHTAPSMLGNMNHDIFYDVCGESRQPRLSVSEKTDIEKCMSKHFELDETLLKMNNTPSIIVTLDSMGSYYHRNLQKLESKTITMQPKKRAYPKHVYHDEISWSDLLHQPDPAWFVEPAQHLITKQSMEVK